MLDTIVQTQFKHWDHVLAMAGPPKKSLGNKCGMIKKAFCGHHGLKSLYGITKKCKTNFKCWSVALKAVMKNEKSAGCLSDCKGYICSTISNITKKYIKGVDNELRAIGCP